MAKTHALVIDTCPSHHQCQTLAGDAGPVTGGGGLMDSRTDKLQDRYISWVGFHGQVCSGNVHASVAPPIAMGA